MISRGGHSGGDRPVEIYQYRACISRHGQVAPKAGTASGTAEFHACKADAGAVSLAMPASTFPQTQLARRGRRSRARFLARTCGVRLWV